MAHWTKTPEGKKKLSEAIKAGYARKRKSQAMKKMWAAKKVAEQVADNVTKPAQSNGKMTIMVEGKDAKLAVSELISIAHYNSLDVAITVRMK